MKRILVVLAILAVMAVAGGADTVVNDPPTKSGDFSGLSAEAHRDFELERAQP